MSIYCKFVCRHTVGYLRAILPSDSQFEWEEFTGTVGLPERSNSMCSVVI